MLRVPWTEKRTNEQILEEIDRTLERRYDIEATSGKTENDVFWSCDARGRSGKGYDAGVPGGKKRKRTTKKEMDGGDTRDDEDESSGAERGDER